MAEHGVAGRDTIGNGAGGTAVAFTAVFFNSDTESLLAVVAGSAGKSLLHFRHGIGTLLGKIENCAVAGLAVFVLCKVCVVAEDNGWSVLETEPDVLGLHGDSHKHDHSRCKEGNNAPVHRNPP